MNNKLNIYISTSDKYHHCLQPFAYLFNKFWLSDKRVTFLGYKEPQVKLPSNFDFISLGEQKGPSYYSEDLRIFFESLNDSHFIYTMEDQFILDYVNFDVIDKLSEYLDGDKVGRACLTNSIFQSIQGKKHDNYDIQEDYEIIEYSYDKIVIKTIIDKSHSGFLVLLNSYNPFWKVNINNDNNYFNEDSIIPTYHCFWGVLVPSGESLITFTYEPPKNFLFSLF